MRICIPNYCGRALACCALNRNRVMSADQPKEDLLTEGILGILAPAVEHVDQKIEEVR